LAEGLFPTSASGQAFEGGNGNCGKESYNANDGKQFDESEGPGRAARGKKISHKEDQYTADLHCQHKLNKQILQLF
jgi:hypothetical protein